MNFLTKYVNKYAEYEILLSKLKYCYTFRAWVPQNQILFNKSRQQLKEFHNKNFATDFSDALSVFSKVNLYRGNFYSDNGTVFYNEPDKYMSGVDIDFIWNQHYEKIFWNSNCEITIDGRKVSFDYKPKYMNINYTQMKIQDLYGTESDVWVERIEATLKEHVEKCLIEAKSKINTTESELKKLLPFLK
jgi:hypothetical protein